MSQRRGIITSGHWIVDINKRIDHWPEPQTLALIDRVVLTNGGAAFNVACDLARLAPEVPVTAIGVIGRDSQGDYILEKCRANGIETTLLTRHDDVPTSFTDVMTERDGGRRTFFHMPGTNALFSEVHIDFAGRQEKIFFLAYLGLLDALDKVGPDGRNGSSRVFEKACAAGFFTATDLVSAPNDVLAAQVNPCLPYVDLLFANEWEAARLIGSTLPANATVSVQEVVDLARRIKSAGLKGRVVIHCPWGGLALEDNGVVITQGAVNMQSEEIAGTSGAGDAFAAGFLLGMHNDMPTEACLELAVCTAAASLTHITCSDGVRPWRECLERGRAAGFREI
jgi:sugar/nucleoside kinase (ribokinase family)